MNHAKWMIILIAISLLLVPQAYVASSSLKRPASLTCTYTIPDTVYKVDGLGNYAHVRPGDTLCLPAGTRGNIKFLNLRGTADQPITIQNTGGIVKITGERFAAGGISISMSSYVRITGTGVSSQCGAAYPPAGQQCGIEIDRTYKGMTIITRGEIHDLEIDHLSIHDTSTEINSRGIIVRPSEGQVVSGLYIHQNYVARTRSEALYIGNEPHGLPLNEVGQLKNIEISYNLVEQTGYDGIKVKVAIENVKVHHNVVRDTALRRVLHHESGIQLAMSVGDVYNNFVINGMEGIASGRPLDNPGTRYFNNIVVGMDSAGILLSENNPKIYNNTVAGSGTYGIKAGGASAQIFDNIVAGTAGAAIAGKAANIFNNFVGSIAAAGFVNAAAGDYHLLAASPAVNAGRNTGLFPAFDYDGVSRPQGANTDLGAYESVSP